LVKVNPAVASQPQKGIMPHVSPVVSPAVTQKQIENRGAIAWNTGEKFQGLKKWHIIQHPFENTKTGYFQFFSNPPPKAAHIVSSQGHAFYMAHAVYGRMPSQAIVNALPDSAAGLGTGTSIPYQPAPPIITHKPQITHHSNPLKDGGDSGIIPKMSQTFPAQVIWHGVLLTRWERRDARRRWET
jgi:hypothetical protein